MTQDTICAISTPAGIGGIAVVRISGNRAISITNNLFIPQGVTTLAERKANSVTFGRIIDEQKNIIDEVVVTLFRAPHCYTGEDTIEIACHGSIYIQQQLIQLLLRNGCRMAHAGEFTQRAFANGKLDLSQAEAVADVIAASSAASHRLAMNQMRGGFSNELATLRMQLLDFSALIELELDFSEEEVEFANRTQLIQLAKQIESVIDHLARSFAIGNVIKNGIPVAIVGETNAGKSTLLNALLNEDKAIVSNIHGTTRDVIEDTINIEGTTFRLIDTAGIRPTSDVIETMGIELTFKKIEQANIVLWLIDSTSPIEDIEALAPQIVPLCEDKKLIIVFNKRDLITPHEKETKDKWVNTLKIEHHYITAKSAQDIAPLINALSQAAQLPEAGNNDVIVTNARHYHALLEAHTAISRVIDGLSQNISGDFLAQDIRECLIHLGEITGGTISTNEILGAIFSRFCIGK